MMKLIHAMTLVLAASACAQAQTFTLLPTPVLGDNPFVINAVSGDGAAVVGSSQQIPHGGVYHTLRWLVGFGADRPAPGQGVALDFASGISADGSVIVGARARTGFTGYDAWINLPGDAYFLTLPDGYTTTDAPLVSRDGRVLAFSVFTPGDPKYPATPVSYNVETRTFTFLGSLPGATSGGPGALNADGSVIVGTFIIDHRSRAFRWTAATGMVDLGVPDGGDFSSAHAVTADGTTIFGAANNGDEGHYLMRWTQETGFVPMGRFESINGVSPDGRVLVGSLENVDVWDDVHGFRTISAVLQAAGLGKSIAGWEIYGVSAVNQGPNGYVFAGLANTAVGGTTWWVATLPSMDGVCPSFLVQPPGLTTAAPGETVTIAASVAGAEPLSLQWFRDNAPLTDDGHFGGTSSPTLVISDARKDDSGRYRLEATNDCDTIISEVAELEVSTPPPPCVPDFNGDWIVNTQDFFDFLTSLFEHSPRADVNHDTLVNSNDFFYFMTAFFEGC